MTKRTDFSNDVAAVKATTDSEVASILKLVGQETAIATSADVPQNAPDSQSVSNSAIRRAEPQEGAQPAGREIRIRRATKPNSKPEPDEGIVLQNVTTRLTRETNELLTEAALRQKLAKRKPDTRQDILEVAFIDWYKKSGYE